MLKVRLQRVGRKNDPAFRLVLTDSKNSTKSGRTIEVLGSYNARRGEPALKEDRIKYWLSVGAKPSPTVHNLLISGNVITGKKVNVLPKKSLPVEVPAQEGSPAPSAEVKQEGSPEITPPSAASEEKAAASETSAA